MKIITVCCGERKRLDVYCDDYKIKKDSGGDTIEFSFSNGRSGEFFNDKVSKLTFKLGNVSYFVERLVKDDKRD